MISCQIIHLVLPNINTIFVSICILNNIINILQWLLWGIIGYIVLIEFILLLLSIILWVNDIVQETNKGIHSTITTDNFKLGFIIFIVREIIFFFSFFWLLFRNNFSPNPEIGIRYVLIKKYINPIGVPLLNSLILLTRGITLTLHHYQIIIQKKDYKFIILTIILGIYFIIIQTIEFIENKFCIRDRVLGSTFYVLTSFHGLHVVIGTILLTYHLLRLLRYNVVNIKRIVIESSIIYWHFVDVVWLILYIFLYFWPN